MNVRISDEWLEKLIAAGFPREDLCLGVAEEILGRLPKRISRLLVDYDLVIESVPAGDQFCVRYREKEDGYTFMLAIAYSQHDTPLANAVAAIYCYLSEQKLLPCV